ncbi:MAG: lysylphosphatidylglycerol synthase domain-containing protein [Cyanobacteriota bacterium]|nr:lysylphosphatidylglycerol synthase domain-containing protein [Cyanobacteriota bacterium]
MSSLYAIAALKQVITILKPYLRWLILGGTLFFLASTLKMHWQEVLALRIDGSGWTKLAIATGVTLLAHIWSGWVWGWIIGEFGRSVRTQWSIRVYLKTNIAKYLPGNVWHYYGRINAARSAGIPLGVSVLSVLMEPLLMAAAALFIALGCSFQATVGWQFVLLIPVLAGFHPRFLNPLLDYLAQLKGKMKKAKDSEEKPIRVKRYPLIPLLGEIGFVGLRGAGFLIAMFALYPFRLAEVPLLLGAFSLAWVIGLLVPGAPGGIGVFEATAIALLEQHISPGIIISAVVLYRFIGTLAEAGGAGLAWLYERFLPDSHRKRATLTEDETNNIS